MPAARFPNFRRLQIGDYRAECPQLKTASQGESYSVRYRLTKVVATYTDRREAEIPQYILLLQVDIRHSQVLLKRVPEQITEDQRIVTNLLLK